MSILRFTDEVILQSLDDGGRPYVKSKPKVDKEIEDEQGRTQDEVLKIKEADAELLELQEALETEVLKIKEAEVRKAELQQRLEESEMLKAKARYMAKARYRATLHKITASKLIAIYDSLSNKDTTEAQLDALIAIHSATIDYETIVNEIKQKVDKTKKPGGSKG